MTSPETQELARQGEDLYERRLRQQLEATHWGQFVAIEPISGDFFVTRKLGEAFEAARAAHPDRLVYVRRVGYPVAVEIGNSPQ
jgi:hypothetical protein